jgi:hypothetical protein
MRHIAPIIGIVGLAPLLIGAGGSNPPPFDTKIVGPQFTASVVMDPHEVGVTSTAKQASIRIYRDNKVTSALFNVPANFVLEHGCDLSFSDARFLFNTLISWIPETVLDTMFNQLETPRSAGFEPIVTRIVNDKCTPDLANPTTSPPALPGILSFQATLRFQAPKSTPP